MTTVVQKYGGSSVTDLDGVRRVAARVRDTVQAGHRVVVVISAMGNTTNELLSLATALSPSPGRRELDMLISVGERISMALLSMAINDLGCPALSLTGSQSGIITDTNHSAARIVAVRPHRVRQGLESGHVVIVAGFQGVSVDKEVTTLGRGGTDLTAVALAAALGAEFCEICSDVDGVWTADPRAVPDALKLDTMSLDEALALARGGGKVLQADAVAYAHRCGIALQASPTDGSGSGTRIQVDALPPRWSSVSIDDQLERFDRDATLLEDLLQAGAPIHRIEPDAVLCDLRNWHDRGAFPRTGQPLAVVCATGSEARLNALEAHRAVIELEKVVPLHRWSASAGTLRVELDRQHARAAADTLHRKLLLAGPYKST
jgi:uridylate kinase